MSSSVTDNESIIILDNGSYQCRAGFSSLAHPSIIYKNVVARNRSSKKDRDWDVQVGLNIRDVEAVRWMIRTPFDLDVVVNFSLQELLLDHAFENLDLQGADSCVNHPVMVTEAIANPHSCRKNMSELLFEAYCIPKLSYGIDCLFSNYHNNPAGLNDTCLIVSSGFQTTHVLPVIRGSPDFAACCRINLGGYNSSAYLQRLLQLRHSQTPCRFTLSRMEEILRECGRISTDYQEEVKLWSSSAFQKTQPQHVFSFKADNSSSNTKESAKNHHLVQENSISLLKSIKLKENRLQELESIAETEEHNAELFEKMLADAGHSSSESLKAAISVLTEDIVKLQDELNSSNQTLSSSSIIGEEFHKLNLTKEVVQAAEIVFQPSLVGFSQGGITDCIECMLKEYDSSVQSQLVSNIFVTGGNTHFPGFAERLRNDVMKIVPFQSKINVRCATDGSLDAWHGARQFCTSAASDIWLTKQVFEECGWDYIQQHKCSNIWEASD